MSEWRKVWDGKGRELIAGPVSVTLDFLSDCRGSEWYASCKILRSGHSIDAQHSEGMVKHLAMGHFAGLLREASARLAELAMEHIEADDCWCEPTVEQYEYGDVVIHNKAGEN